MKPFERVPPLGNNGALFLIAKVVHLLRAL
jgi:hypothetical protein